MRFRIIVKSPDFAGMRDWYGYEKPPTVANRFFRREGAP